MTYKLILSVLLVLGLGLAVANEVEARYWINGREVTLEQWGEERPYVPEIPLSAFRDKEQVGVESTPPLSVECEQCKCDRKLNTALVVLVCLVVAGGGWGLLVFRRK